MAEQLQLRRGTATEMAIFTAAQGEVVIDITNNRAIVGDGATVGGWPAAKLSEVLTNYRTPVADANYVVLATSRLVAYTSLTANRTVSLPAASSFPTGTPLTIVNEILTPGTFSISVVANGSDNLPGSIKLKNPSSSVTLESNGVNGWTVLALYEYTQIASVSDANYTINITNRVVIAATLTASRIFTLPAANFFQPGTPLLIVDQSGNCSPTKTITITASGSDTFASAATSMVFQEAYQFAVLISNGSNLWLKSAESPLKGNRGKTITLATTGTISTYGGSVEFTGTSPFTATITTPATGINYTPTLDLWNNSTATITLSSTVNFVGPLGTSTTTKTLAAGNTLYLEYDGSAWVVKR